MKTISRTVRSAAEMALLVNYLGQITQYPVAVTIKPGQEPRTLKQNRLFWQWMQDLEAQGDQTAQEYRAICKLHFGIPILRAENEDFRAQYDKTVRGLPYETKLALMLEPIEFPVTRLMTVKQEKAFLDAVWHHFTALGYALTDPGVMGLESYGRAA